MGERQTAAAAGPAPCPDPRLSEELAAGPACSAAAAGTTASAPTRTIAATSTSTLTADPADLEFYLAVDVIYHRSRAGFLAARHRWFMFFTIVFGSSAVAGGQAGLFGLLAAAFGAADLCFDPIGRSQIHRELARRLTELVTRFAQAEATTQFAAVRKQFIEITEDEPAHYHFARLMAHNRAIKALGRDETRIVPIKLRHRILAHVWRFDSET
jgi:hypothetical protein